MVVIEELAAAGALVRVWTDKAFRARIEAAGAEFVDLFDPVAVDDADSRSSPRGVRGVTFAADRGRAVAAQAAAFHPDLIVHDGFAFIGRVVAHLLELPRITVTAGHAVDAAAFRAALSSDPRVSVDERCWSAVARLRDDYGIADASPFSYVADPSPWLNICKEPAEWVNERERAFLGPVAFFGALPRDAMARGMSEPAADGPRIYAAFGTVIWRYWTDAAVQALESVAIASASIRGARVTVGLGGAHVPETARRALVARGVAVRDFADQWAELRNADVFVTHHGLGSTHEAVACAVPMLSLPFFWDQPGLARRAQELGVALPLMEGDVRVDGLEPDAVVRGLRGIAAQRTVMRQRLLTARQWEARTITTRPQLATRILAVGR